MNAALHAAPAFYLIATYAFVFGLAFGSFLNVCIYRLPRGLSVVSPRSACPGCGLPVRPYDNLPVLSWLILRGRCRDCKTPISPRYLLVEMLVGVLFLLCVLHFGANLIALKFCAFCFLIVGLIFTDLETRLLPDKMTFPGIASGFAFALVARVSGPFPLFLLGWARRHPQPGWVWSLGNALLGAAFAAGMIWMVAIAYEKLRGVEGMGFGDVKLMGLIGAFLGINLSLLTLLLGSFVGMLSGGLMMVVVYHRRKSRNAKRGVKQPAQKAWSAARTLYRNYEMPFGVFLGMAAMVAAFAGDKIIRWYWGLYL